MVSGDGRERCIGCKQLTQIDRADGKTVLHWSTAREKCGPQITQLRRWWA